MLEMRELRGDDMFILLSIVGKLDIKDEFVEMFSENIDSMPQDCKEKEPTNAEKLELEKKAEKQGMKLMANIMQKFLINAKTLKVELNELLADLTSTDIETIKSLGLKEYTKLIMDFFKKEELKDFFTSIASLI